MAKLSKLELLLAMGFKVDPFKQVRMKTGDSCRIDRVVGMAVQSRAMVNIIGERGIGKSNAVRAALTKSKDTHPIFIESNDIRGLRISDIEQAIIFDLGNGEKPKRSREIRSRQLRPIIGDASRRKNICLVIEEGHQLHGQTLRSLKRLREMVWMGESGLLSVIIIGQSNPMNKQGMAEVRLRSDSVVMQGLIGEEVKTFAARTVGRVFDDEVLDMLPGLPDSHNFEDLKALFFSLMESAVCSGRKQVTKDDLAGVFGGLTLEEERERVGMSVADLTKRSGLQRREVSSLLKKNEESNLHHKTKEGIDILRDVLTEYGNEEQPVQHQATG